MTQSHDPSAPFRHALIDVHGNYRSQRLTHEPPDELVSEQVTLRVYTFDRRVFDGQVTDITPAGDFATRKDWGAQRRDIRTFTVTARVPNPERLLKDGMTAEVTIIVSPSVRQNSLARQ